MKNLTNHTILNEYCELKLPNHYDLHWLIAYISLSIVGLFYTLLGTGISYSKKKYRKFLRFRLSLVAFNNVYNIIWSWIIITLYDIFHTTNNK